MAQSYLTTFRQGVSDYMLYEESNTAPTGANGIITAPKTFGTVGDVVVFDSGMIGRALRIIDGDAVNIGRSTITATTPTSLTTDAGWSPPSGGNVHWGILSKPGMMLRNFYPYDAVSKLPANLTPPDMPIMAISGRSNHVVRQKTTEHTEMTFRIAVQLATPGKDQALIEDLAVRCHDRVMRGRLVNFGMTPTGYSIGAVVVTGMTFDFKELPASDDSRSLAAVGYYWTCEFAIDCAILRAVQATA